MKKKYIGILFILLISIAGLIYWMETVFSVSYSFVKVKTAGDISLQIFLPRGDYKIIEKENEAEERPIFGADSRQLEVIKAGDTVGDLIFEGILLPGSDDFYYFLKYSPRIDDETPLEFHVKVNAKSKEVTERHILYDYDQLKQEPVLTIPNSIWTEPAVIASGYGLPKQALFIDGEDFSMHLNMVNVYEPLENGVRKERFDLTQPIQYLADKQKQEFIISFPQVAGTEIEQWGIIGKEGMVNWGDEEQENILLVANLDRVRKWTQGGVQYVTPETYYPYDPRAFWVVPAQHVGNKLLLEGNNRFSTNFARLALQAALRTQTEGGYWISSPRSTWLYGDYGIDAGFYDTRFNTDAGLFLLHGYREFGEEAYLQGALRYGDFLIEYAGTHHHKTKNDGYLVYDYTHGGDMDRKTETLTSLNHLITEMNFLYELYKDTDEKRYLYTAEKMRQAVKDTASYWKKDDGDLWYAYLPDGSYGLQDYPLLTLKDLRYSQRMIQEIYGDKDMDFQYLIDVKESYLTARGLPLYD
ncbi:hypothetical protein [Geosporobacter ferrireducens]|uniref:hypothetical protein n=1 Tax=Geosporobacter ferrireducens TaxID=1424294 RepID=UPI00139E20F5|nr:hypothetical protein [Geosporobacter ferrireducens]MTI53333.1 hypothetical protein [Geosporobacter ferrireducens]